MQDSKSYKNQFLNSIKGCFVGGAAGDALGYAVEFFDEDTIFQKYGACGITEYKLDEKSGKALISDDTQMSLFTANGILVGKSRLQERGLGAPISVYVQYVYLDWLKTQTLPYDAVRSMKRGYGSEVTSWLCDVPELFSIRAPGNTCLDGLKVRKMADERINHSDFLKNGSEGEYEQYSSLLRDFCKRPINNSKGCGGVMRVAPLAMAYDVYEGKIDLLKKVDEQGAEIAAITHGHPLGYLPAAVLVHILQRIIFSRNHHNLEDIVVEAKTAVSEIYKDIHQIDNYLKELSRLIDIAIELSKNDESDLDNIHRLGEGWVAEETLAIAIYCSLKYSNEFTKAIIAAVNHKGDSDSTGAVTGNIVGALVGYDAIDDKWKENLELADVILEMSEDVCFQNSNYCSSVEHTINDEIWETKYWKMERVAPYQAESRD